MAGFSINSVAVSGNLTRDPELRSLPSGTSLCSLRIAVNERVKDQGGNWGDRANYFNVTVWGGQGEWLAQNLGKGDGLAVAGRLRWREWQAQDGTNRQDVEIVADSAVPIGRREGGGGGRQSQQAQDFAARDDGFAPRSDVPSGGFEPQPAGAAPPDDDIPF